MARSLAEARAERQVAAHRRALGELLAWRCLVELAPGAVCDEEGLVEWRPDVDAAGLELHRHYLARHYRPPATPSRSRRRT